MTTAELLDRVSKDNQIQFEHIKGMIVASGERTAQSVDEVKATIKEMHNTLTDHNGRIRKSDEKNIRMDEQLKIIKNAVAHQAGFCEKNVLKVSKLTKLNKWIEYINKNTWKVVLIGVTLMYVLLLSATIMYHYVGKLF